MTRGVNQEHSPLSTTLLNEYVHNDFTKPSISYDDVPAIKDLYRSYRGIRYELGYSARDVKTGVELMYFSHSLQIPPAAGAPSMCWAGLAAASRRRAGKPHRSSVRPEGGRSGQ